MVNHRKSELSRQFVETTETQLEEGSRGTETESDDDPERIPKTSLL